MQNKGGAMSTTLQIIGSNMYTGFSSLGDFWMDSYNSAKSSFSQYLYSKDFESDLDSIIEALYAHTNKRPDFNLPDDFE